ncbi:hypothetical protein [Cyclobacterium xiamenense]|uniref:hypothetical protein n=1 Tax=Cyclobacterium xiamenense TaxID=1297121 RepID=UPI0035D12F9F
MPFQTMCGISEGVLSQLRELTVLYRGGARPGGRAPEGKDFKEEDWRDWTLWGSCRKNPESVDPPGGGHPGNRKGFELNEKIRSRSYSEAIQVLKI